MRDHPSKARWESENVLVARVKVNRNQDPELYQYLKGSERSSKANKKDPAAVTSGHRVRRGRCYQHRPQMLPHNQGKPIITRAALRSQ